MTYMFKVWYKYGSTFQGKDDEIFLAPTMNVQAIVQNKPKGWHTVSHCPVYMYESGMRFYGGDWMDFFQYLSRPMRERVILIGSTMQTEMFLKMLEDAKSHQEHDLYQEARGYMEAKIRDDQS